MTEEVGDVSMGDESREVRRKAISNCSNSEAFLEAELISNVLAVEPMRVGVRMKQRVMKTYTKKILFSFNCFISKAVTL